MTEREELAEVRDRVTRNMEYDHAEGLGVSIVGFADLRVLLAAAARTQEGRNDD